MLKWKIKYSVIPINSFLANGNFCHQITFATSLYPDLALQNVGPELDSVRLTIKEFFEKVKFEKKSAEDKKKKHAKLPSMQRVKWACTKFRTSMALSKLAPVLKTFFINVSFHILGASLTLMGLF